MFSFLSRTRRGAAGMPASAAAATSAAAAAATGSPSGSASPQSVPMPRGPFVLPKDRPARRKAKDAATADGAVAEGDANAGAAWCNWMCRLCVIKEAPAWSVHNNYIHTGYRDTSTFRGAIRSVLMVHNETANIWTHLVGLAIFVAITVSMVFGWGGAPMPALPDTWVTGANATRVALVARTVHFRAAVEASRVMLLHVASGLRGVGVHSPDHDTSVRSPDHDTSVHSPDHDTSLGNEPDEGDNARWRGSGDRRAPNSGGGKSMGTHSTGFGGGIGGGVGEGLDAATSALLHVASGLRRHLHLPDHPLAADARAALHDRLDDARAKVKQAATALARSGSAALHGLEDAAAEAARDAVGLLEQQVHALHTQLESTPEDIEMPDEPAPRWPMYVFLAGACVCLSFSSVCHTLACVGARVSSIVWRIDYVGIAVLIVASFYPVVYYSFYCVPGLRTFYLSVMSAFGVAVLIISLMDRFQAPQYTPYRAVLFSGLGACGAFPILHQTFFTWRVVPTPMIVTFWLELLMGACYLMGAYIYAVAVPEKWKPGRFDVWMSSHNIFHILVVMGAYVHYRAALVLMAWRDHHRCDADVTLLREWYVQGGWMGHYGPWSGLESPGGAGGKNIGEL